jgi:hypothetical protein
LSEDECIRNAVKPESNQCFSGTFLLNSVAFTYVSGMRAEGVGRRSKFSMRLAAALH